MPAAPCDDNPLGRNTGYGVSGIHPEYCSDHLSACAHSRLDGEDLGKRDNPSADIGWLNQYLFDEEGKKDWTFELILITSLLPFPGRSLFIYFPKLSEGAPRPFLV